MARIFCAVVVSPKVHFIRTSMCSPSITDSQCPSTGDPNFYVASVAGWRATLTSQRDFFRISLHHHLPYTYLLQFKSINFPIFCTAYRSDRNLRTHTSTCTIMYVCTYVLVLVAFAARITQ